MDESVKSTGWLMHELGEGAIPSNPLPLPHFGAARVSLYMQACTHIQTHSCVIQFIISVFSFHLFLTVLSSVLPLSFSINLSRIEFLPLRCFQEIVEGKA